MGLDSFYYTGFNSDASFKGDTVFYSSEKFTAIIIDYSDGKVCSKKILFVFKAGTVLPIDSREIMVNCDRELNSDYYYTDYRLLPGSVIETTEYFMPPETNDGSDTARVHEMIKLVINTEGKIDTASIK